MVEILSLGNQYLTGVFPKDKNFKITNGPLDLLWCSNDCLVQLKQSYKLSEMYGDNYGYRSGLNKSMVAHLKSKISFLESMIDLKDDDIVIDIGSNDSTSLNSYNSNCIKVGIDPTGKKFKEFYKKSTHLIPDFFTADLFREKISR